MSGTFISGITLIGPDLSAKRREIGIFWVLPCEMASFGVVVGPLSHEGDFGLFSGRGGEAILGA